MNEQRRAVRPALLRRELLNKVPEITIFFWIIKVLCTTVGETAADFLDTNLNLGLTNTTYITGALLVFALLVVPAAAAQALTARPALGLATSVGLALLITWLGLAVGYYTDYPVGFWITSIAFGVYLVAKSWEWLAGRARDGVVAAP